MKIIKVNRYSSRIFEAVLRLLPQVAYTADLPDEEYFQSVLRSRNIHFFIAELADKQIAGMLTVATCNLPSGIKIWIEDVVVDETHRGEGLGKELMLFAIDYSRSLGAKQIELTSRPSRVAANKLYQKLGFIHYETNVYKYQL
jgi:ribosomal protein S18 acetylase RimI-like enzyme